MKFEFRSRSYDLREWLPATGAIGPTFAFDTETALIADGEVPCFVVGTAHAGGETVYWISLSNLAAFVQQHQESTWIMHNAPFDICVVEEELGISFDTLIRGKRIFDTSLLYRLIKLAEVGSVPFKHKLDLVAREYLGVELDKNEDVRCGYGAYRNEDAVDYARFTKEAWQYAATDSIATFQLFEILHAQVLEIDPQNHLSHKIQLMGAYALHRISLLGIGFDLSRRNHLLAELNKEVAGAEQDLEKFGWVFGRPGNQAVYESIINRLGLQLPTTAISGKTSDAAEDLSPYREQFPFIDSYLVRKEHSKLKSFIERLEKPRIFPSFNALVSTGRTSSFEPNLQNLPRRPGIRECFVPAAGHVFLQIDYAQIELCTLAQVCFDMYGESKMRDLINDRVDLHKAFASTITGKPISEIGDESVERQWAKACNFGFPGGLGTKSFLQYAEKTYQIKDLTEDRAKALREQWLDTFPEMRKYLADTMLSRADFGSLNWCKNPEIAAALFKRIISGETTAKSSGKPYSEELLDWAFGIILPQLAPELEGIRTGSLELLKKVGREEVSTRTGRIRGRSTYCQVRNTPFQGLAADGAKIALYRLVRAKYRVVNFIHDEFLIEIPAGEHAEIAAAVEKIVVDAMKCVVPDVAIRAKWKILDRWRK